MTEPEHRGLSIEPTLLRRIQEGMGISEKKAIGLVALWCGLQVISSGVAGLPLKVYEHLDDDRRREARGHAMWRPLQVSPDGLVSSVDWFQTLMLHALLRGNGCAEIRRNAYGQPTGKFSLFDFRDVKVEHGIDPTTKEESIKYTFIQGGKVLWARDVIHVRNMSLDGITGLSPVKCLADALGGVMAVEEFGRRYFENNAHLGGVWELPATWGEPEIRNFEAKLERDYAGVDNAGKDHVAYAGSKYTPIDRSPVNSQMVESRTFGIGEVCRALNIQPHKLFKLSRSTFSNIEESNLDHYQTTLAPWAARIEAELNLKLFDDGRYYVEHTLEGVLRGRPADRIAYYTGLSNLGVITPNQIAAKENLPGVGPEGDKPRVPLNKGPMEPESAPAPAPEADVDRSALVDALRVVVSEDRRRLAAREAQAVRRALGKDPAGLREWAVNYYGSHLDTASKILGPSWRAWSTVAEESPSIEEVAGDWCRRHLEALVGLVVTQAPGEGLEEAVDRLLDQWQEEAW